MKLLLHSARARRSLGNLPPGVAGVVMGAEVVAEADVVALPSPDQLHHSPDGRCALCGGPRCAFPADWSQLSGRLALRGRWCCRRCDPRAMSSRRVKLNRRPGRQPT